MAAKDCSLYFLLLKDRKTHYVWVRPVSKKSGELQDFLQWLAVAERETKKSVRLLRSDRGGEFLGKEFTAFVDGKGIVHDLTCPCTPQRNGMAEREMRTMVESVRTMLLQMGVQQHWWHLALRQAVRVRNCLERSPLLPGTTPYQLLTWKKPDLSLARVWGCMAQFMVPEKLCGGKLKLKARWSLHLGVSEESKGWELLDIADNRVVTTSNVVFYENMSLELTEEDAVVRPPSPSPAPPTPPLVADMRRLTTTSASGDEGRSGASPVAPAKSITGGRRDTVKIGVGAKLAPTGEQQAEEVQPTLVKPAKEAPARKQSIGEHAAAKSTKEQSATGQSTGEPTAGEESAGKPTVVQLDVEGSDASDNGGDAEEPTDSNVVEAQPGP
ncbi:unnamed protein product [Closterium sp. NIES-54]